MKLMRICVQGLGFLILGLVIACAEIPKTKLTAYTESFTAARSVSEQILADYEAAQKENAAIEAVIAARKAGKKQSIPETFDPKTALATDGVDDSIAVRLQMLETIARYNEVLVALAEGQSVEEVKGSLTALTGSVTILLGTFGTAVPGLSLATPIVKNFLELVETARTREAFINGVKAGEPIIRQIIDKGLIADTVDFYGVRHSLATRELRRIRRTGLDFAKTVTKLAAEHLEPTAGSALEASKLATQKRLSAALVLLDHEDTEVTVTGGIKRKISDLKGQSAGTTRAPPYSELLQVRMGQLVEATESAADKYQKTIKDMKDYHELLSAYVRLLNQTKTTLEGVVVQLDSPPNIEQLARELATTAIKLRSDFEALRSRRSL